MFSPGSWGVLILSHLIRSCFDNFSQDQLKREVTALKVEVHRTRDLLESYNQVLDGCERETAWLKLSGSVLASVNVFLGLIILGLVVYSHWISRPRPRQPISAPVLEDAPIDLRGPTLRQGPVKPSDLARGGPLR